MDVDTKTQIVRAVREAVEEFIVNAETIALERKGSGKFARTPRATRASLALAVAVQRDEGGRFVGSIDHRATFPPTDVVGSRVFGTEAPMPEPQPSDHGQPGGQGA